MIKIVTRNSKLAIWQAEFISQKLKVGGIANELLPISTKGDKILDVTLSKIGSKGVFTEELENMLAAGEADIAVHSAKDLQSTLPDGFEILAFTEREKVNDVLLSRNSLTLEDSFTVGTSSTRRVAFLKHQFPHLQIVDMRGNLQTRIAKMDRGDCDALLLAYAGVQRMGYSNLIKHTFPIDHFMPAVGQGSLAVECHKRLDPSLKKNIFGLLNHPNTSKCLKAERAYLATMNGGCSIPVFGTASCTGNNIHLTAGIVALNGKIKLQESLRGEDPIKLGQEMGKLILNQGGYNILQEIRRALNQP
ncbi:MAG: hydroxymethylbilane synthase [Cyclobacteriaceae bacterium]